MRKWLAVIILSILLITIIIAFLPLRQALVFQPKHATEKLAYLPIINESDFKIKYIHSIHLSDVIECYKITAKNEIQQYELIYEDFSIGMPANAEEGESFERINGKYHIKNMHRIFPSFYLRIGQVHANHRVVYKDREYPLARTIKPGTSVKIEIRKLSFFQQWKGVNILESL